MLLTKILIALDMVGLFSKADVSDSAVVFPVLMNALLG